MGRQQPRTTQIASHMAARARGRGSSHGINGAILETGLGSAETVVEGDPRSGKVRAGCQERCINRDLIRKRQYHSSFSEAFHPPAF